MRVVSVMPLYPPAFQALTASRSAGTHGPVRNLAVISSNSAWLGSAGLVFRRGMEYLPVVHPSRLGVMGRFDVEAALRRHLAIPPRGIAATTSICPTTRLDGGVETYSTPGF